MVNKENIAEYFRSLQLDICQQLEALDGQAAFREDSWARAEGGGGHSRIIENGHLIAKGGVNFSQVHGPLSPSASKALKVDANQFFATGVSIVLHPNNPWVPIIHMNVRYFEVDQNTWWFGGGIDLTPHYIIDEDARFFHKALKATCDKHQADFYSRFKPWADDYFFIRHREETRGIGGIFYDRLDGKEDLPKEALFDFSKSVGESFVPMYSTIAERRRAQTYGKKELDWQALRRSRYVEFNLVWDRGTKFGLETGGRTESILMSMPPQATWIYDHQVDADSMESNTLSQLKKGIDWLSGAG